VFEIRVRPVGVRESWEVLCGSIVFFCVEWSGVERSGGKIVYILCCDSYAFVGLYAFYSCLVDE
jgi:hypothetical protein